MFSQTLPGYSGHSTPVLRTMFEARKRIFVDLLKWDVPVIDGRYEIDQFDTPDADYLILTNDHARHRASARLLHTDRPHILGNLFPCLCDGPVPSGGSIREITRFCIEPTLVRADRHQARNQLVTALVQHALGNGITAYTAVANRAWFRQIAEFGWKCRALGPVLKIGDEMLVALQIEIDGNTADDLYAKGIFCPSSFTLAATEQLQ